MSMYIFLSRQMTLVLGERTKLQVILILEQRIQVQLDARGHL